MTLEQGAVYVATGIGAAALSSAETQPITLYTPGGGWFGGAGRAGVVQVACGRDVVYGRTAGGQLLYWTRKQGGNGDEQEGAAVLAFEGPYQYAELKRARVTHVAGGFSVVGVWLEDGQLGLGWYICGWFDPTLPVHSANQQRGRSTPSSSRRTGRRGRWGRTPMGGLGLGRARGWWARAWCWRRRRASKCRRGRGSWGHRAAGALFCGIRRESMLMVFERLICTYIFRHNDSAHTLLLDDAGGAWSCGSDFWWQLGLGETWKVTKDRPEANFPGKDVGWRLGLVVVVDGLM